MADCHDLFEQFYGEIKLSHSQLDYLKQARNALRKKVREHFDEMEYIRPKFCGQGSYAMSTIINPLDEEYDIDDGVYLQNLDEQDMGRWPSPSTVHKWIYEAAKGHTDEDPVDKRTCIRVAYSGHYHVDLPIYGEYDEGFYLAEKGAKGWHPSDPKALTDWFVKQVRGKGEQLRRIVRYFKAWGDYQSRRCTLPSGLILTILSVRNFEAGGSKTTERDDAVFGKTVKNVYVQISRSFRICNPIDEEEVLSERLTEPQKKNFKRLLSVLREAAGAALREDSEKAACKIWKAELGDKFPNCDDVKEKQVPLRTSGPALLRNDARSA